jgi:hypothetical protein
MSIFDPNLKANPRMDTGGLSKLLADPSWTLTSKPFDRDRPFHRINSPDFAPGAPRVSGKGYDCGCRSPAVDYSFSLDELRSFARAMGLDLPFPFSLITIPFDLLVHIIIRAKGAFKEILRTAPSWVPVDRRGSDPAFPEGVREVEGILWHSFQTWTDVPVFEWHRWYDWNFHIMPAHGYDHLRGLGNDVPVKSELKDKDHLDAVGSEEAMECEWDVGAFGKRPGPMYDETLGGAFPPERDWAWPMTGQYLWVSGRHIYDCGHANSRASTADEDHSGDKTGPNPGLMRTELHPILALATARWEAFRFDANGDRFVPAVQFLLFASRLGGYWDFQTVKPGGFLARRAAAPDATKDYEFIVDLPKPEPQSEEPHPLGHTETFLENTLVMRPRLLMHFDSAQFKNAQGTVAGKDEALPVVTPLMPAKGSVPEQVKVTFPMASLPASADAYGVLVSMGWHDPDGRESAKIRKVTVTLNGVLKGSVDHDVLGEEWTLRVGVNGRWHHIQQPENAFHNGATWPLNKTLVFHLALEDRIQISMHGFDRNLIGQFLEGSAAERRLRAGSGDDTMHTVWLPEADSPDIARSQQVARDMLFKMARTMNSGNEPIGIIDPAVKTAPADAPNPITVKEFIGLFGEGADVPLSLTGFLTKEDSHSAELFYDLKKVDYVLRYHVKVEPLPSGPPA